MGALRDLGYVCDVVESRVPIPNAPPHAKRTKDCFGFFDVLAFPGPDMPKPLVAWGTPVLVQCTSAGHGHVQERKKKIEANDVAMHLARHGIAFVEVWGFRKRKLALKENRRLKRCALCYGRGTRHLFSQGILRTCEKCGGKGKVARREPGARRAVRWTYMRQRLILARGKPLWIDVHDGVAVPIGEKR